tara:strand:+ start:745 stop:1935 length:1191 start_codon:yes stop_codon:yes gene_type:complete
LSVAIILLLAAIASSAGLLILQIGLWRVFAVAPRLKGQSFDSPPPETSLTVVIPAYNEAVNIGACLQSVLDSTSPCTAWSVLVVDDASTDATAEIALRAASDRLEICSVLQAGPRPAGERWVGKNWACSRAMEQVTSEWVLFIDADVRLSPDALRRALVQAIEEKADLFSLAPRLECGCLAEWMVQPIMASLLGLGFPIEATNDPDSDVAFAAGPFMLFSSQAYAAIGGHRQLAAEVVEDLALARRIKSSGYRLVYQLGLDAVMLRMYQDLPALWEGWTKNWLIGLDRDVLRALGASGVVLQMFTLPWLVLPAALVLLVLLPQLAVWWRLSLGLASVALLQQWLLRLWTRRRFDLPMRHWWLMGAGGLLVGLIGPVSVWRTLTGRGWTWKGRSLAD